MLSVFKIIFFFGRVSEEVEKAIAYPVAFSWLTFGIVRRKGNIKTRAKTSVEMALYFLVEKMLLSFVCLKGLRKRRRTNLIVL